MTDTIFAPSTGPGASAVAVIRISGFGAIAVVEAVMVGPLPEPRRLELRAVQTPDGKILDQALVAIFPDKRSFTGEPSAEIHCHGGPAVVSAILDLLEAQPGCRLADPGEFTRRALLNGKLDLTQVEGLGDLIAAETELQRRQALRMMSGGTGQKTEAWRAQLIRARALIEVTIDWADEEVPEDVGPEVREILEGLREDFSTELHRGKAAEKLRQGFEVAIVGPPNVGKSTLLNAIAGRDVAIVADIPGTTRDVLEVRTDLGGLPVIFLDTAGLRDGGDAIEAEGIRRARARAEAADLRLHISAPGAELGNDDLVRDGDLAIWAKADIEAGLGDIQISAKDGQGVDAVLETVRQRLSVRVSEEATLGHRRQLIAVEQASEAVSRCLSGLGRSETELLAEDLREAIAALDRLTGRMQMDDVLDVVFGSFCLGK